MEKKYIFGIDAGGTKVAYGLFNEKGEMFDRYEHPSEIDADGPRFADAMIRTVREMLEKNGIALEEVQGIGVCMPSYVLYDKGYIMMTTALVNVREFGMRDYMQERLPGVKVLLDNDGNVAALAEHRRGAGRGCSNMVYVAVSTGVGSGIVINGKLFRGDYGAAGECGHMLATPDAGTLCGCRNKGCFMSHVSGRNLYRRVKIRMLEGEETVLPEDREFDARDLLEAYREGDALAAEEVRSMAHYLAVCVYNIYELLNIRTFVFGGGLTHYGEALFVPMREEFDRYNHNEMPVEFRQAELGRDFGIIGAAELLNE